MYVIKSKWVNFSNTFAFSFSCVLLKKCIDFALARRVGKRWLLTKFPNWKPCKQRFCSIRGIVFIKELNAFIRLILKSPYYFFPILIFFFIISRSLSVIRQGEIKGLTRLSNKKNDNYGTRKKYYNHGRRKFITTLPKLRSFLDQAKKKKKVTDEYFL